MLEMRNIWRLGERTDAANYEWDQVPCSGADCLPDVNDCGEAEQGGEGDGSAFGGIVVVVLVCHINEKQTAFPRNGYCWDHGTMLYMDFFHSLSMFCSVEWDWELAGYVQVGSSEAPWSGIYTRIRATSSFNKSTCTKIDKKAKGGAAKLPGHPASGNGVSTEKGYGYENERPPSYGNNFRIVRSFQSRSSEDGLFKLSFIPFLQKLRDINPSHQHPPLYRILLSWSSLSTTTHLLVLLEASSLLYSASVPSFTSTSSSEQGPGS